MRDMEPIRRAAAISLPPSPRRKTDSPGNRSWPQIGWTKTVFKHHHHQASQLGQKHSAAWPCRVKETRMDGLTGGIDGKMEVLTTPPAVVPGMWSLSFWIPRRLGRPRVRSGPPRGFDPARPSPLPFGSLYWAAFGDRGIAFASPDRRDPARIPGHGTSRRAWADGCTAGQTVPAGYGVVATRLHF